MEGRPVAFSRTTITELMVPAYANFGGKIHGGLLLSLMDKVAYACASKHAGTYCVTVSVDGVDFLQPVEVGELVSLRASVNYVGRTSLVVGIKGISENVRTRVMKHTNTCYFTMVAKDDESRLVEVPPLVLQTVEDVRRFIAAVQRRRLKSEMIAKMEAYKRDFAIGEDVQAFLQGQRCIVDLDGASPTIAGEP